MHSNAELGTNNQRVFTAGKKKKTILIKDKKHAILSKKNIPIILITPHVAFYVFFRLP